MGLELFRCQADDIFVLVAEDVVGRGFQILQHGAAGKDVLVADGASGAAAVEFLEAAYLAAAENRTVAVSELLSS